jgi:hypothetical protein
VPTFALITLITAAMVWVDRKAGWNVPENVVVNVSFSPKHKRRMADLKLDAKNFRKVIDAHVIGVFYYVND